MSNNIIAVAGSRGRTSMVAVESYDIAGQRRPQKLVRFARRFDPTSEPGEMARQVLRLADTFADERGSDGRDPMIVVSSAVAGGALLDVLREAKESGLRMPDGSRRKLARNPLGITTYAAAATTGIAQHCPPNELAAWLYREYDSGRLEFATGLDALRSQMAAFVPVETKVGNIAFGNEDMSDYDDMVVALMHAVRAAGRMTRPQFGVPRYRDREGGMWPSRGMAVARVGQLAR